MIIFWQVGEPEKLILDSREKIEYYRTKMQELVSNFYLQSFLVFVCLIFIEPQYLFILFQYNKIVSLFIKGEGSENILDQFETC